MVSGVLDAHLTKLPDEISNIAPLRRSRRTSATSTDSNGSTSPGRKPLKNTKVEENKDALQNFFKQTTDPFGKKLFFKK